MALEDTLARLNEELKAAEQDLSSLLLSPLDEVGLEDAILNKAQEIHKITNEMSSIIGAIN